MGAETTLRTSLLTFLYWLQLWTLVHIDTFVHRYCIVWHRPVLGVSYRFPKNFKAKLNKNEWNIYKYSGKHRWSWTYNLANHLYYKISDFHQKKNSPNSTLPLLLTLSFYYVRESAICLLNLADRHVEIKYSLGTVSPGRHLHTIPYHL